MQHYLMKQFFIVFWVDIGNLLTGLSVMWSSPVIVKLQDIDLTPLSYTISDQEASWLASSISLGSIIGPHLVGKLSNRIGRKYCLIIGGLIVIFAYSLHAAAQNLAMIYAGRILSGFGVGIIAVTNIVYIGEIASTNIRGILLTSTGVFHSFGSLIAFTVGPFMSFTNFQYFIISFSIIYLVGIIFVPESPVFYIIRGQQDAAKKTFNNLGVINNNDKEFEQMVDNVRRNQENKRGFLEIFTVKSNRKALTIVLTLLIIQNCCGILTVSMLSMTIFQNSGTTVSPEIATVIVGVTQLFGAILTPAIVEKTGRRILLLISTIGCSLSMIVLWIYFYLDALDHTSISSMGWLPLTTVVIAILTYSIGLNIIPDTLLGEMFSPNVRSMGSSFCITIGWLAGATVTVNFGYIVAAAGIHYVFLMFSIINVLGIIFTVAFVPETKGKSLIEIQKMLAK